LSLIGKLDARCMCTAPLSSVQYATGKRKDAVARVWVSAGSSTDGAITVNGKSLDEFTAGLFYHKDDVLAPLEVTQMQGSVDVKSTVKGGGCSGQVGAIRLGIARALSIMRPETRPVLRSAGYLTRDSRIVERKKPGQKKARKKFQWVKR